MLNMLLHLPIAIFVCCVSVKLYIARPNFNQIMMSTAWLHFYIILFLILVSSRVSFRLVLVSGCVITLLIMQYTEVDASLPFFGKLQRRANQKSDA